MEINKLLEKGVDLIKDREFGNPVLEAILILSNLLNVDKTYIYTHGKDEVSQEVEDKYLKLMNKRASGYPVQYILKEREFMGLDFYIEEGVLVPRPDTEILVEYIIEYIKEEYGKKKINILDLGIGSGAISLSLAYYCRNAEVYGIDIGDIPLKVANINKEKFNLNNVNFYKGDLFKAIKGLSLEEKFHIIVSNPPYIPREEIDKLQDEVKDFEPRLALDGGEDGLDFYRRITPKSKTYLIKGGLLIYEIGYDQGKAVRDILTKEGFQRVSILKDLQGLDRAIFGIK
ncbi:peptide chain release factor N(5)-glutamine methyltransferase [Tissierella sp. MSJ-40]|uniref:Release factor glutamine methyltransferase n=1 Tax=Tissierella simiarum TaxID=2841534 RepID=A0ABS6E3C3_9FIRM|nr:peptide chain release factor N(5)-glutamine methyltransferase [Tissierella simiarum]MBU5436748.1 peptide chain release factor N(5)-glutamine methyltransferase [Tissierella simiarum]